MKCPACGHEDSRVADSRVCDDGAAVRRRRECPECGKRFTTYERPGETRLFVVKKDGRREAFDRDKVLQGLSKACEKRPVSRETLEAAVDEIERRLRDELAEEPPTSEIGAMVMEKLKEIDPVAFVRFASVYKEFRDTDSFLKEIADLRLGNAYEVPAATTDEQS
ncbi:MAG: transcriptional repressor NrdR [Armatimonadetes bacterium]|nr:transcriptional repressor NrdR [Armatimonadota bacterium]NIM23039.1 transcriptional repressor NrdR [Armatimonadota bacterium]NIM66907.1 transcriptional repressor NrdR [Armatimonadota bacterium]NIM75441.1 transcriptional repressor NrdR [Armatimonadota bacterium]NIN05098.1 transcriptional repressor NrdR [Armatimonadota bacterium]